MRKTDTQASIHSFHHLLPSVHHSICPPVYQLATAESSAAFCMLNTLVSLRLEVSDEELNPSSHSHIVQSQCSPLQRNSQWEQLTVLRVCSVPGQVPRPCLCGHSLLCMWVHWRAYQRHQCTGSIRPSLQSGSSFLSSILASFRFITNLVSLVMLHPTFIPCGGDQCLWYNKKHTFSWFSP